MDCISVGKFENRRPTFFQIYVSLHQNLIYTAGQSFSVTWQWFLKRKTFPRKKKPDFSFSNLLFVRLYVAFVYSATRCLKCNSMLNWFSSSSAFNSYVNTATLFTNRLFARSGHIACFQTVKDYVRVCKLWDWQLLIHIVIKCRPSFTKSPSLV